MSRRRAVSEDERILFEHSFRNAIPLMPLDGKLKKTGGKKAEIEKPVSAKRSALHRPSGLDGNTAERLRRGDLEPQARLDLHGLTERAAHRALITFIHAAFARGMRLVIVVTGKGLKPAASDEPFDLELDSRRRGVLKNMAPRWLSEPELARCVADVRSAHRSHGGTGALYVYLRKNSR
jgi:DNA-nicking Smr family endonuclease